MDNAVLLKPAPEARHVGVQLVTDDRLAQVILTGATQTARRFLSQPRHEVLVAMASMGVGTWVAPRQSVTALECGALMREVATSETTHHKQPTQRAKATYKTYQKWQRNALQ